MQMNTLMVSGELLCSQMDGGVVETNVEEKLEIPLCCWQDELAVFCLSHCMKDSSFPSS